VEEKDEDRNDFFSQMQWSRSSQKTLSISLDSSLLEFNQGAALHSNDFANRSVKLGSQPDPTLIRDWGKAIEDGY